MRTDALASGLELGQSRPEYLESDARIGLAEDDILVTPVCFHILQHFVVLLGEIELEIKKRR
jgi:hypothetical protein